jgi:hypothetical protein
MINIRLQLLKKEMNINLSELTRSLHEMGWNEKKFHPTWDGIVPSHTELWNLYTVIRNVMIIGFEYFLKAERK